MRKIPTLFKRVFTTDHKKTITREVTPGCECVLRGECTATVKWDGACCAIINGEIYKRYDAKTGKDGKRKIPPEGAIPCQPEPDPITGHWPHWVKCEDGKPEDKYFLMAYQNFICRRHKNMQDGAQPVKLHPLGWSGWAIYDGTYEAVGPAWQSNPQEVRNNTLVRHGINVIPHQAIEDKEQNDKIFRVSNHREISFSSIRDYLEHMPIEGIVFWKDGEPVCKIKRSDFGFPWPPKKGENA